MSSSALLSSMTARPLRGVGSKDKTPTEGCGTGSTVSMPIRRDRQQVGRFWDWTQHSTCSTSGPSDRACACCDAGSKCTSCMHWNNFKNQATLLPYPNMVRGLLGEFARGAAWTASYPPFRGAAGSPSETILTDGSGERGAWGDTAGQATPKRGANNEEAWGGWSNGSVREGYW